MSNNRLLIVVGFLVTCTTAADASPDVVRMVKSSTGHSGQAFHVDHTRWLTALHVVSDSDPRKVELYGIGTFKCELVAQDEAHDLALLNCPHSESVPEMKLPGPQGAKVRDALVVSAMYYSTDAFTTSVLTRVISFVPANSNAQSCINGDGALTLVDVPHPGDSGSPIVGRLEDNSEILLGMWMGGWSSTSVNAGTPSVSNVGIALDAYTVSVFLQASDSSAPVSSVKTQTLMSCDPVKPSLSVNATPDDCQVAADSASSSGPSLDQVKNKCPTIPPNDLEQRRGIALAKEAIFEAISGPAGWALIIDSAFSSRVGAEAFLPRHSTKLTRLWDSIHGGPFLSGIEYRLFDASVLALRNLAANDPQLQATASKFFGVDPSGLRVEAYMTSIAFTKINDTPRWLLCLLTQGASDLSWTSQPSTYNACMSSNVGWPEVAKQAEAEFNAQHCSRVVQLAPVTALTWFDYAKSPRLQVSIWLALDHLGLINIAKGFENVISSANESMPSFADSELAVRKELHELRKYGGALGQDGVKALDELAALVDETSNAKRSPVDFLRSNSCLVSLDQKRYAGVSISYLTDLDVLTKIVCADPTRLGAWCGDLGPSLSFTPNSIPTARNAMVTWLKQRELDKVVTVDSIKPVDIGSGKKLYWLYLKPVSKQNFGEQWRQLSADIATKTGNDEDLNSYVALGFAAAMNVDRVNVAVYVDNVCDDLRIRMFRGSRVFSSSMRCASAYAATAMLGVNVDALASRIAQSLSTTVSQGKLTLCENELKEFFSKREHAVITFQREDPDAGSNQEAEFMVAQLRGRVTGEQMWEQLTGYLMLQPLPLPPGAKFRTYKLKLVSVIGQSVSGGPDTAPSVGYGPLDSKYEPVLNNYLAAALEAVRIKLSNTTP